MATQPKPRNNPHLSQYVTQQQAASALHVDVKTIRRMISKRELPAVKVGVLPPGRVKDTRLLRIPADALDAILSPVQPLPDNPWGGK